MASDIRVYGRQINHFQDSILRLESEIVEIHKSMKNMYHKIELKESKVNFDILKSRFEVF